MNETESQDIVAYNIPDAYVGRTIDKVLFN